MNPQRSYEISGLNVPEQHGQLPPAPGGEATPGYAGERAAGVRFEHAAPAPPPMFPPTAPSQQQAAPMPMPAMPPAPSRVPQQRTQSNPPIADDGDLIEKAWVLKAKQIVARTRSDPYRQNEEMTRMKADYIKKRYNKDIKLTND